jgi:hypothetical protein
VRTFLGFSLSLVPALARAEVLDKELNLPELVVFVGAGMLAAYLAARYRPWALLIVVPAVGLVLAAHYSEFLDPAVGSAMRNEGGFMYVVATWCAAPLVLAAVAAGYVRKRWARRVP